MNLLAVLCSFLIGCNWIGAITVPSITSSNKTIQRSTNAEFVEKRTRIGNSADRIRRLIPYMTFYIPSSNRGGFNINVPISDEYNFKQLVIQQPDAYKPSVITNFGGRPLYLNGGATTTMRPALPRHQPQLSVYFNGKNHNSNNNNNGFVNNVTQLHAIVLNGRPQQSTNQYAELLIPQRPTLNHEFYDIKNLQQQQQQQQQHQQQESQSSHNTEQNYITPFLPSNQLPGSFRPIIYRHSAKEPSHKVNSPHLAPINTILRQQQSSQPLIELISTTPKPFYLVSEMMQKPVQQQHYSTYIHTEPQVIQVLSTTPEPVQNDIDEPIVVKVKTVPKPIARPVIHHSENNAILPTIPTESSVQNIKVTNAHTNINYDLDPNDGYDSKVTLNNYRLTKHRNGEQALNKNNVRIIQTTVVPRVQHPTSNHGSRYEYENIPLSSYESPSEKPYRTSVASADTHQHLTETTQTQPPIIDFYHSTNHQPHYHGDAQRNELNVVPQYKPVHNSIADPYTKISNAKQSAANVVANLNATSLTLLLKKLQESNHLPKTFTPDNIDSSIKTLVKILNNLKKSQKITKLASQHYENDDESDYHSDGHGKPNQATLYNGLPGPNSGQPGIDYPNYAEIPHTTFNCKEQRYKGFFGDPETHCQVWHYCDLNGGQSSFLCPNGTIFSQMSLTCDWWFNVKCSATAQLYVLNERLYKYILPFSPKFPEDYSGPLVDKYLAIKFQEMEEKMNREKNKNRMKDDEHESEESAHTETPTMQIQGDDALLIDDEGQRHNIDNAVQQPLTASAYGTERSAEVNAHYDSTTSDPDQALPTIIITTENDLNEQHGMLNASTTPVPPSGDIPPPKVEVESEKLEVIEITSDGSSGHIVPGRH